MIVGLLAVISIVLICGLIEMLLSAQLSNGCLVSGVSVRPGILGQAPPIGMTIVTWGLIGF